jgi:tRNA modification GTPase
LAAAAQRTTATQQARSEVTILCLDAARPLNAWEQSELANDTPRRIVIYTKHDQATEPLPSAILATSAPTHVGLDELRDRLRRALFETTASNGSGASGHPSSVTPATAQRAASSLAAAEGALAAALQIVRCGAGEELVASELRHALDALGEITGAVFTDDILDRVFSRFCIGK